MAFYNRLLERYIKGTHGKTHTLYSMQVEELFECCKKSEEERFRRDLG